MWKQYCASRRCGPLAPSDTDAPDPVLHAYAGVKCPAEERIAHLRRIHSSSQSMVSIAEEKLALAGAAYDTVDRQIRRLDTDLLKTERSLHAGLRRELTNEDAGPSGTQSLPLASDRFSPDGQLLTFWSGLVSLDPLTCLAYLREHLATELTALPKHKHTAHEAAPPPDLLRPADADVDPSEPRYCYCDRVSFGEMVACDNDDCPREWVGALTHPVPLYLCRARRTAQGALVLPVLCTPRLEGPRPADSARCASTSVDSLPRGSTAPSTPATRRVAMSGYMYPTEEARREKPDDTSFLAFFQSMPAAVKGTVRLFDRQEYYTVHGDDALYVADTVFKTKSVLKYLGKKSDQGGVPSCTLSLTAAKSFLRDALTTQQLRIEIWAPSSGDGSGRRTGAWHLSKQASPGNLQDVEDLLFLQADVVSNPIVLALRVRAKDGVNTVGAAFADATNRELGVAEYIENDLFSNTEVRALANPVAPDPARGEGMLAARRRCARRL